MTLRSLVLLALACSCCGEGSVATAAAETAETGAARTGGASTTKSGLIPPTGPKETPAASPPAQSEALTPGQFAELFQRLSEPGGGFYSDNYVSNETSYLQVASELDKRAIGGAYLGVGPEQNLSYIAITRPRLAFIVDIRRDNALLHLLYKGLFELADSRADFLALLLGREQVAASPTGLTVTEVVERAQAMPRDSDLHMRAHRRIVSLLVEELALGLSEDDLTRLAEIHQAFFVGQLDLKFEWHKDNGTNYPSLRELLLATDAGGRKRGFLASEDSFGFVKQLHSQHRIIPVVGDFAGDRALQQIAEELERRAIPLAVFYVSNVEQYLVKSRSRWQGWRRNLAALPRTDSAVFVRSYLAGDKQHPAQMPDHRTATLLQPIARMLEKERYQSYWELTTE
jgi:hypothetical protein